MAESVYEHPHTLSFEDGREYRIRVLGEERSDHTWSGWIEFIDTESRRKLSTGQETSQPNREALVYWATGLEHVYFDGALERANTHRRKRQTASRKSAISR